MARLNKSNVNEIYSAWRTLSNVMPKLGQFFVLAFVAADSNTGYLTLPKRLVCRALKLKDERYRAFFDALLNLRLITEDLRWDKKTGSCVHYRMVPYAKSFLSEVTDLDDSEAAARIKIEIAKPVPRLSPDDPYDFVRDAWRAGAGRRVSINGARGSRAPKRPRKGNWPMAFGQLMPENPFHEQANKTGTACTSSELPESLERKAVEMKVRLTERQKRQYVSKYESTVKKLEEIKHDLENEMKTSSAEYTPPSDLTDVLPLSTQAGGVHLVNDSSAGNQAETEVTPSSTSSIPAISGGLGGANAIPEGERADLVLPKPLKLGFQAKHQFGLVAKPKLDSLLESQFMGVDPMKLDRTDRVRYLWYTFNRIAKRFPKLVQHPMPLVLVNGAYEFKESGNPTLDRMYEWAAKDEWFIHWTHCLYRIVFNRFLHGGTDKWKITVQWLFRPVRILDADSEETTELGLYIDERVLNLGWGIGNGSYYDRRNGVSSLEEGYVEVYEDGLDNWTLLAHLGLAEFDPWFKPSIDIMNARENGMEIEEYLAAVSKV